MENELEIWKQIDGWGGFYYVSNMGRVKVLPKPRKPGVGGGRKHERILKQSYSFKYLRVKLDLRGISKCFSVHRLVALAFIPNPDGKREVNHINGNKSDNRLINLEWATPSENQLHAYKFLGKKNNQKILSESPLSESVVQYNKTGEYVNSFDSIIEASLKTKVNKGNISSCACGKRKTAGGFIWKHKK